MGLDFWLWLWVSCSSCRVKRVREEDSAAMADSVVSFLLENLTQLLSQESKLLGGVEDQVRLLRSEEHTSELQSPA